MSLFETMQQKNKNKNKNMSRWKIYFDKIGCEQWKKVGKLKSDI